MSDPAQALSPNKQLLLQRRLKGVAGKVSPGRTIQPQPQANPHLQSARLKYPLSFAEERLWFLDQLDPNRAIYNLPFGLRLVGRLNVTVVERCLNEIVHRHQILRTNFESEEGRPVQVVKPVVSLEIDLENLSGSSEEQREIELKQICKEQARRPFDLSRDVLIRSRLIKLGPAEHLLFINMHHIVSDGWSIGLLLNEWRMLYQAFVEGRSSPLPELPVQYGDFAAWQRQWPQRESLEKQIAYWRKQLDSAPPLLELPTDRPRPITQKYRGAEVSQELPRALVGELAGLTRQEGATLFITLLAAFQAVLHRYTAQDDISVGVPIAGRNLPEVEGLIGFFVNTLVMRGNLSDNPSFRTLLERIREVAYGAYAHQDVPFEMLVKELQPKRDMSHSPLFQVMFVFLNIPWETVRVGDVEAAPLLFETGASQFDLTLSIREQGDRLKVVIEYDTDLFEAETMRRLLGHYQRLLEGIVANPDERLSELPLLPTAERRQLVEEWNRTEADYPRDKCVHQLFEEQVEKTPAAVAVVFENKQLTYRELNDRANQLAHHLQKVGVGPDILVGICVERSLEMVIGLLGILKAGGAYVPLDPGYPRDRLAFMVEDAHVPVLLTQKSLLGLIPPHKARIIQLDADWPAIAAESSGPVASPVTAQHLAYMIYTSGSTGQPKGILVTHRNLVHSTQARSFYYIDQVRCFLLVSSYAFDSSVAGIFWTMSQGGKLVLPLPGHEREPLELVKLISFHKISHLLCLPTLYEILLASSDHSTDLEPLEVVIVAGENCPGELIGRHCHRSVIAQLYNEYGPTECTVWATVFRINGETARRTVPIGRPIANTQIYILDRNLQPVPIGVGGELHIGGIGLARGYHNRAELTAEKFIPDPFSSEPGARLYKTGDLARYLPDGNIECLGRLDHQVKLRGFRIELGEIEALLNGHPGIREAVVLAREDTAGDQRLVAYVVPRNGSVPVPELREDLSRRLPDYMVPSAFVMLSELPLTPNGKVDRKALPKPEFESSAAQFIPPSTPTEIALAKIWGEILGVKRAGLQDNFFALGGHSLIATRLVSRVNDIFGVGFLLRALFEHPTLADLAKRIDLLLSQKLLQGENIKFNAASIISPRPAQLPLSFAQERLWFLDQLEPGEAFYNIPLGLRLKGRLEAGLLRESLNEVVRRHEVLRTHFAVVGGQPQQVIEPAKPLPLELLELSQLAELEREAEVMRLCAEEARRPFDLAHGPVLRARLFHLGAEEHVFLLVMHHIAADAWSISVLMEELTALYQAFAEGKAAPLPELPVQYADYAVWQREWLRGEVLGQQLDYWKQQLAGAPRLLELPADRPRPATQGHRGALQQLELSSSLLTGLAELSRQEGASLFMTLLAAFQTLLHRYAGVEDVVVGSPIAGRNRSELEGLVGFFVNTLVLRGDLSGAPSFRELLRRTREMALGAYAHQDLPFERLVEALQPERDPSHSPLFQIMFVLQNAPATTARLAGLAATPLPFDSGTAKFDLTLFVIEQEGSLQTVVEYDTDLFEAETMRRLLGHYQRLLEGIVANPDERLSELPLLPTAERRQLVEEWNRTEADYPWDKCVHQLFEEQVEKTPAAVAVVFENKQLTYRELNDRANQLAHHLQKVGVGPDILVGICVERSLEMVIGLLGILKAGGAYVPLDPGYPRDRLAFMVEDAHVPVLLTQKSLLGLIPPHKARIIQLDADWPAIAAESSGPVASPVTAQHLAYMIYTSGSTGQPKGAAMSHGPLTNLISWQLQKSVLLRARTLQFASLSFDVSFQEIFSTLCGGGTLLIVSQTMRRDLAELLRYLIKESAERIFLPFVVLQHLAEIAISERLFPSRLRELITAGEQLRITHQIASLFERLGDCRLQNQYGPTESHVVTAYTLSGPPKEWMPLPPIGRPIANTQIYILDRNLQPVPIGVGGELHIGGIGLARGYHNRAELTAEKFIPDPFSSEPGARLYKTGDLARYLPDGNIECLGRLDHQVKLRGFRIELGEIEALLNGHPGIREAVVLAREDTAGDQRLVAYVVPRNGSVPVPELREDLSRRLPDYMVPSAFVMLSELPLTPNGKVDRKALPKPEFESSAAQFIPPSTPTEIALAKIWGEILGVKRAGLQDNFFALGGHSLIATRLVSRVNDIFGVGFLLRALFEHPTLADLAKRIDLLLWARQEVQIPGAKTDEQLVEGKL